MSGSSIVGVAKADAWIKEVAGSVTFEIDDIEAEPGNKQVAGEVGVTKAELGNKQAAGPGVVTEASWIKFVFPKPPLELLERKAEPPTGALITRERVPDVIIDRLKMKRPFTKLPPIKYESDLYIIFPELRESYLSTMTRWNYLVDLHVDVLRQVEEKGSAEVGVDFTDGVKKIFILAQPPTAPIPAAVPSDDR